MSKKRPTKKPKPTPRVYLIARYSIPFGGSLAGDNKRSAKEEFTARIPKRVAFYMNVDEDIEDFVAVLEGVEVRR